MRLSLAPLLLAAVATTAAACAIDYDRNGDGVNDSCIGQYCEDPPGPPAPEPFAIEIEGSSDRASAALAVGGRLDLRVWSRAGVAPSLRSENAAIEVTLGPAEGAWRSATVRGIAAGTTRIDVTDGVASTQLALEVGVFDHVEVGVVGVREADDVEDDAVLAGTDTLVLQLRDASGRRLLDHSLALDGWTDPGFTQARWDLLTTPGFAGQFGLRVRADAFGVRTIPVTVVEAADALAVELDQPGRTAGRLCVHAEAGGQPVIGTSWSLRDAVDVTITATEFGNCVDYLYALPGARLTASFGGVTQVLEVRPPVAPE